MKGTKSSARYALALIDLAVEQQKLEEVMSDIQLVAKTIEENHDLELLMHSPIVKFDKKQEVLRLVFGPFVQEMTIKFMELVCAKGREAMLPYVVRAFIAIYKERKGIVTADVTSAVALSDAQRKEVIAALASIGTTIDLIEHVDPSLLGGLSIKVGDQRVDASLRRKLNELKYDIHNS